MSRSRSSVITVPPPQSPLRAFLSHYQSWSFQLIASNILVPRGIWPTRISNSLTLPLFHHLHFKLMTIILNGPSVLLSNLAKFSLLAHSAPLQEVDFISSQVLNTFFSLFELRRWPCFLFYWEYQSPQKKVSFSSENICWFIYASDLLSRYSGWTGLASSIYALGSFLQWLKDFHPVVIPSCNCSLRFLSFLDHSHQLTNILEYFLSLKILLDPIYLPNPYSSTPFAVKLLKRDVFLCHPCSFTRSSSSIRSNQITCQGHLVARPVTDTQFSSYLTALSLCKRLLHPLWDIAFGCRDKMH